MKRARRVQVFTALLGLMLLVGASGFDSHSLQFEPDIEVRNPISISTETESRFPLSVEQGELIIIEAKVFNSSSTPVEAPFDVSFDVFDFPPNASALAEGAITCLSNPDPGDSSKCLIARLGAVGSSSSSVTVKAQLDTTSLSPSSQEYGIFAIADSDDVIFENDTSNNVGQSFFFLKAIAPNFLVLEGLVTSGSTLVQGEILQIEFMVENDRPADIAHFTKVEFQIRKRGERFQTLGYPGFSCNCRRITLRANSELIIQAQVLTQFLEPGEYQIRMVMDPNHLIIESDERDNIGTLSFVIE